VAAPVAQTNRTGKWQEPNKWKPIGFPPRRNSTPKNKNGAAEKTTASQQGKHLGWGLVTRRILHWKNETLPFEKFSATTQTSAI